MYKSSDILSLLSVIKREKKQLKNLLLKIFYYICDNLIYF